VPSRAFASLRRSEEFLLSFTETKADDIIDSSRVSQTAFATRPVRSARRQVVTF